MWRGKSSGDEDADQSRGGSGPSRSRANARQPQQSRRGGPGGDPRSKATGKKIRRIESGSPGSQGGLARRGPGGAERGPGGRPQPYGPRRGPGDATELGGPPATPPGSPSGRLPSDLNPPVVMTRPPDLSMGGSRPGGGGPSLPPLTQPSTGELPRIGGRANTPDDTPDDTVVVTATEATATEAGVFGQRAQAGEHEFGDTAFGAGLAGPGLDDPVEDLTGGTETGRRPDPDRSRFDSPMPSALPAADDPFAIAPDTTGGLPEVDPMDEIFGGVTGDVDPAATPLRSGFAAARDQAPSNPFPEVADDITGQLADRARSGAAKRRSLDDPASTRLDSGAPMAVGVSAAAVRQAAGRGIDGTTQMDVPTDLGQTPRTGGRSDRRTSDPVDRLQDTEFKLADRQRKPKPKEPNRLLLGLAMGLVVLAGIAVAWFLTRGGNEDTTEATDDATGADAEVVAGPESGVEDQPDETTPAAGAEPQVEEPTLFFEEAQAGPLVQGETYSIDIAGEPEGSLLQVVVDDIPQGAPDPQLPDLILPAGRHSLYIQITNGADVSTSTPVEVYVVGDMPPKGFRANLSSVNIQEEGWAEAVRQFDEFRAAGHEGLQLAPLTPGYWNIFVADLGEELSAAKAYCESFGLAVPDQCFPTYYEGEAAPADTTATTAAEAMEDGSTTSTSAAGG